MHQPGRSRRLYFANSICQLSRRRAASLVFVAESARTNGILISGIPHSYRQSASGARGTAPFVPLSLSLLPFFSLYTRELSIPYVCVCVQPVRVLVPVHLLVGCYGQVLVPVGIPAGFNNESFLRRERDSLRIVPGDFSF